MGLGSSSYQEDRGLLVLEHGKRLVASIRDHARLARVELLSEASQLSLSRGTAPLHF